MQALIGNILDRCITDAGYRGHNAPPDYKFKVYTLNLRLERGICKNDRSMQRAAR